MTRLFLIISFISFLASCKESDDFFSVYSGNARARKNGEPWNDNLYVRTAPDPLFGYGFDLVIDRFNESRFLRETLFFNKIDYQKGLFQIDTFDVRVDTFRIGGGYYTSSDDGDVGCDFYKVLSGDGIQNQVEIISYNEKTRIVEGKFDVTLIIDLSFRPRCNPNAPDTIRFSDGWFRTRIKE